MYITLPLFLFIMWTPYAIASQIEKDQYLDDTEDDLDDWKYKSTTQYTVTPPPREHLSCVEKQMILEGLERYKWNTRLFAKELGISRAGLLTKIAKYKLEKKGDLT